MNEARREEVPATAHCNICRNSKFDMIKGYYCGLTETKRTIERTCSDFKFIDRMKWEITNLNDELAKPENNLLDLRGNLLKWFAIGIAGLSGGYYLP